MPEIIQLSRMTNNGMPAYAVSVMQDMLNERGYPLKNTTIAVLGVAYKKNVDDPRESPFYEVQELLNRKGAVLNIFDSWYSAENTVQTLDEALEGAKAILIVTEHNDVVEKLQQLNFSNIGIEVVIDGRNCLDSETIVSQGVIYRGIGRKA